MTLCLATSVAVGLMTGSFVVDLYDLVDFMFLFRWLHMLGM